MQRFPRNLIGLLPKGCIPAHPHEEIFNNLQLPDRRNRDSILRMAESNSGAPISAMGRCARMGKILPSNRRFTSRLCDALHTWDCFPYHSFATASKELAAAVAFACCSALRD